MQLVINASTLSGTGVTQVAVSFINECKRIGNCEFHIFLSVSVEKELNLEEFPENFNFYYFSSHPLYGLRGFYVRKELRRLESLIEPDCVFSVFGPSWWTPRSPHIMGYAYPHYVYSDSPFFNKISIFSKLKVSLYKSIHKFFLMRNGDFYICETEDVSSRLSKFLKIEEKRIFTVSNTINHYFESYDPRNPRLLKHKKEDEFRLLSLCSLAPHKNLLVLNKIIPILKRNGLNIKFVLTVDQGKFQSLFSEEAKESIINLGRVSVGDCPTLYRECDALFLPTTLECSTANYPEAMMMEIPILTSNLSFATSVCKDAALYFDPYNEDEIVEKIEIIINNDQIRKKLVEAGRVQLKNFSTAKERAAKYLEIAELVSNGSKN